MTAKSTPADSSLNTPSGLHPRGPSPNIQDALHSAFGPGGKVYQKNRDADDMGGWGRSASPGSGSHTPNVQGSMSQPAPVMARAGGAVTMQEQDGKGRSRIDQTGKAKGKEEEKIWDLPKSKEMKWLEGITVDLKALQAGETKVKMDGQLLDCFCQGWYFLSSHRVSCTS